MTPEDFITNVIELGYDIQDISTTPTAQSARTRIRVLYETQAAANFITSSYPWDWRLSSGTLTLNTSTYLAPHPSDFGAYGPRTQAFRSSDGVILQPKPLMLLQFWKVTNPSAALPLFWARALNAIMCFPGGTGSVSILLKDYLLKMPTLADNSSTSTLDTMPEPLQQTVLFDLVVSKLMFRAGDGRAQEMRLEADRQLKAFWRDSNTNGMPNYVPRYGRMRP